MKSGCWHEATIWAATLNRAASRLSRTILRPRMPPAALHQSTKAWDSWNSSMSRPGTAVLPGSDMVAARISVSVTPLSVAPDAFPGPQTALSVPKSPGPGPAAVVVVTAAACVVADDELELWLLHPAAIIANDTPTTAIELRKRSTISPPTPPDARDVCRAMGTATPSP